MRGLMGFAILIGFGKGWVVLDSMGLGSDGFWGRCALKREQIACTVLKAVCCGFFNLPVSEKGEKKGSAKA